MPRSTGQDEHPCAAIAEAALAQVRHTVGTLKEGCNAMQKAVSVQNVELGTNNPLAGVPKKAIRFFEPAIDFL